jgi:hypothetical protein
VRRGWRLKMLRFVMARQGTLCWMRLTALFLTALWLPSSSHAWLESAGLIHSPEQGVHDASHEAADGCCRVEHGTPPPKPQPLGVHPLPPELPALVALHGFPAMPPSSATCCRSTAPPPELAATWQFSQRAAPSARAPSAAA